MDGLMLSPKQEREAVVRRRATAVGWRAAVARWRAAAAGWRAAAAGRRGLQWKEGEGCSGRKEAAAAAGRRGSDGGMESGLPTAGHVTQ